jgi:hypothetical protein
MGQPDRGHGPHQLAINHSVGQVARRFIDGNQMKEGMLNRVSAVVRAYGPCLNCSTHADAPVMSGFLLDTNIPSEMLRLRPDPSVAAWLKRQANEMLFVSVVTMGELRRGITLLAERSSTTVPSAAPSATVANEFPALIAGAGDRAATGDFPLPARPGGPPRKRVWCDWRAVYFQV